MAAKRREMMSKKVISNARRTKAANSSKSKSLKSAGKTTKAASSLNQKSPSKTYIERGGGFVSAKTGRVIKSSPAKPRLGKERIQTAVRSYVRGDDRT